MNDTKNLHAGLFDSMVGQKRAKGLLNVELGNYLYSHKVPVLLLTGPYGEGKTTLARAFAKGLFQFTEDGKDLVMIEDKNGNKKPKIKDFIEIPCASLKSVDAFINHILIPYVQDKDVTLFFDEASEIPHKITMALLSLLNTEQGDVTTYTHEEYVVEINHKRQSFIFATSEVQEIFKPLLSRMEQIDLEDYTVNEMCEIVQKHSKDIKFEAGVLEQVASALRGNAREARKMAANKIVPFLRGRNKFTQKDWDTLSELLGITPLGLNPQEIVILRHLAENNGGMSLTCLASKTGLSREALQRSYEMYLQRHGLMKIDTGGREITSKGLQVIRQITGTGTVSKPKGKTTQPIFRSSIVQIK